MVKFKQGPKGLLADISFDTSISYPIFGEIGANVYSDILPKFKYYSPEDLGTICTLFATSRFRDQNMPDANFIRFVCIERVFYRKWVEKNERDKNLIDTFLEYAKYTPKPQMEKLWKNSKMHMPITVLGLPIKTSDINYSMTEHTLDDATVKQITKALASDGFSKKNTIIVGKNLVPSGLFYDNLQKYEKQAYQAFYRKGDAHNSNFERQRPFDTITTNERLLYIPIYVKLNGLGAVDLDYFYSYQSPILKINKAKVESVLNKHLDVQCSVVGDCMVPGNAVLEFARIESNMADGDSALNKNIRLMSDAIQKIENSFYLDVKPRGGLTIAKSFECKTHEDKLKTSEELPLVLKEMMWQGGCFLCFTELIPDNPSVIYGYALDSFSLEKIPSSILRAYHVPILKEREYSSLLFEYESGSRMVNSYLQIKKDDKSQKDIQQPSQENTEKAADDILPSSESVTNTEEPSYPSKKSSDNDVFSQFFCE